MTNINGMRKRRDIKKDAKRNYRRNFLSCFLACLIYMFLAGGMLSISETVAADEAILTEIAKETEGTALSSFLNRVNAGIEEVKDATSLGERSNAGVISSVYKSSLKAGGLNNAFLSSINRLVFGDKISRQFIIVIEGLFALFVAVFV
ncbi:MAG: hypothetical protein LBH63_02030, partial [Clostridiales Family XIII bacterium]|nr:hypothetical protein [Clostridiales Family XIII bacterium]